MGTMTKRQIYDEVFHPEHENMGFKCFRGKINEWKKHLADEKTLAYGTYPDFTAHAATVQVDREGRVTQAWIKQQKETLDWIKIRDIIVADAPKSDIVPTTISGDTMLEIPLFDLHFGIATLITYQSVLADLIGIVSIKQYEEINIIIGQDLFHNNDMRGHTAKLTPIDKVDFVQSWADAWAFFCTIIDSCLNHSPKVKILYSKGNHDECVSWCFFKALEAIYPQVESDDSLAPRKCIFWRGCFIGYGHCEYTTKSSLIFQNFVLDFPQEFAQAKVREIHSGHLHRESIDVGIMVRRLPSAVPTSEWSSDNGLTGSHKRFQIFEWAENRLKQISYI